MKSKINVKNAGIIIVSTILLFSTAMVSADNLQNQNIITDNMSLIWDNGYPDLFLSIPSQIGGELWFSQVADDIHTTETNTITRVEWDAITTDLFNWISKNCNLSIYEYTPSGPGDLIMSLIVDGTRELIGEHQEVPWYRYSIDLIEEGEVFDLPPGDYFFSVTPISYDYLWGRNSWLTSEGSPSSESMLYLRNDDLLTEWTPSNVVFFGYELDVSFRIYSLPEKTELEIGPVEDGFGLSTAIKNIGLIPAENVTWEIQLDGGIILIPSGGVETGGPVTIAPGAEEAISVFAFGFGGFIQPLDIIVTANADNADPVETTTPAQLMLIFVII